jgi:hypothetical protein
MHLSSAIQRGQRAGAGVWTASHQAFIAPRILIIFLLFHKQIIQGIAAAGLKE